MLKEELGKIKSLDKYYFEEARKRLDNLTKPPGSLGRLEEFAAQIVAITENTMPEMGKKVVFTFAGDHGVTKAGVSAYPSEVTPQMVFNFLAGGAGINVLARHARADVVVVDIGVNHDFADAKGLIHKKVVSGTKNMLEEPAMTRQEAEQCIEVGIELVREYKKKGYGLIGTGDMGIGNTTPSSAIASVITGMDPDDVTGYGTGITYEVFTKKVSVIRRAIEKNSPNPCEPPRVAPSRAGDRLFVCTAADQLCGESFDRLDGFPLPVAGLPANVLGEFIFSCQERPYQLRRHPFARDLHADAQPLDLGGVKPLLVAGDDKIKLFPSYQLNQFCFPEIILR